MPRKLNRLSARFVTSCATPGMYADGAGLYLRIRSATSRSWIYVWHVAGKRREMGLGALPGVGVGKARQKAQEAREVIVDGGDPVALKRCKQYVPTFGELADQFIQDRIGTVKSEKSVARWKRCIGQDGYAKPLREIPVNKVTTEDVVRVLKPLWTTKPTTAGTLRGYIEGVLNAAKASGHRQGENPAAWAGHLSMILPKRSRLAQGHHKAMAFKKLPHFMAKLKDMQSQGARALELTILCATRTTETLHADWSEIDLAARIWDLPASRMKAGKGHRIPLSNEAVRLLEALPHRTGLLFPGRGPDLPLSNMAMGMALRRMDASVTVHGFRSTFRDWAGDVADAPREIAEAALAHTVGNSAEQAYRPATLWRSGGHSCSSGAPIVLARAVVDQE